MGTRLEVRALDGVARAVVAAGCRAEWEMEATSVARGNGKVALRVAVRRAVRWAAVRVTVTRGCEVAAAVAGVAVAAA